MKKKLFKVVFVFINLTFFHLNMDLTFAQSLYDDVMVIPPPVEDNQNPNQSFQLQPNEDLIKIPVVVHVIHDGGPENISNEQIVDAILQLNEDFRNSNGVAGAVDTKVEFYLASKDPDGNCTSGIIRIQSTLTNHVSTNQQDVILKDLSRWPNTRYLNIWIVKCIDANCPLLSAGGVIAYSLTPCFPSNFATNPPTIFCFTPGQSNSWDIADGIVIRYDVFGRIAPAIDTYKHTLTHEAGHWLNLQHVFGPKNLLNIPANSQWHWCHPSSENLVQGDFVADTPPQADFSGDCTNSEHRNTCHMDDPDSFDLPDNYMDYNFACQAKFTSGQKQRMRDCLQNYRSVIWNQPNQECNEFSFGENWEINENTIWSVTNLPNNGEISIKGTLTIKSGNVLTIQPGVIIHFCDKGKLIIEKNARLDLSGTLTGNECGNSWDGVVVCGDSEVSQYPKNGIYNQGKFLGKPGALIENAITAIQLWGDKYLSDGGGQISCSGVVFKNNRYSIRFAPFVNYFPTMATPRDYFGSINNCTFIIDDEYKIQNLPFFAFIDLVGVRGVSISACTFINEKNITGTDITDWGYGIYSINSTFNLFAKCSNNSVPCNAYANNQFSKLGYGIYQLKDPLAQISKTTISGSNFTNCFIGIFGRNAHNTKINTCAFNLGSVPSNTPIIVYNHGQSVTAYQVGIAFDFKTDMGINVENCSFNKIPGNVTTSLGITGYNTGGWSAPIRKNIIQGLTYGSVMAASNYDTNYDSGVFFECNTFANNSTNDIFISSGGIKISQGGAINLTSYKAAENGFSYYPGVTGSDITNNGAQIKYYFDPIVNPIPPTGMNQEPLDVIGSIQKISAQRNTCISSEPCIGCFDLEELSTLKNSFYTNRNLFKISKQDFITNPSNQNYLRRDYYRSKMIDDANFVTNIILADTLGFNNDSLRTWMQNFELIEADLWVASDFVKNGDLIYADQILNSIGLKYSLNDNEQADLYEFKELLHFLSNKPLYNLSSTDIDYLKDKINNGGYVSGPIKNILTFYGYYFRPEYPFTQSVERDDLTLLSNVEGLKGAVKVYPVPTDGAIVFDLDIENFNELTLKIVDLNGHLIKEFEHLKSKQKITWDHPSILPGVYMYYLQDGVSLKQSGKVILK